MNKEKEYLSWQQIEELIKETVKKLVSQNYKHIFGITIGGIIPAILIARELDIKDITFIPAGEGLQVSLGGYWSDVLIVDDIYDTGKTYEIVNSAYRDIGVVFDYACLLTRYETDKVFYGSVLNHDKWIVFPWEKE